MNIDQNCGACGNWELVDLSNNGVCTACPVGEVARGDRCQACLPGSIPGPSNQCLSCGLREISVAGQCVPCRAGEGADKVTNTCVECPADVVIDWNAIPIGTCADSAEFPIPPNYGSVSPPGDVCPTELWYEVAHLEQAVARGGDSVEFRVGAAEPPENELACTTRYHQLEQFRYVNSADALWQLFENRELNGVWSDTPGPLLFGQCTWPGITHTLGAAEITGGVGTVRFMAQSLDQSLRSAVPVEALLHIRSKHYVGDECIPE